MLKGLILEKKVCNMRYAPECSEKVKRVETYFRKNKFNLLRFNPTCQRPAVSGRERHKITKVQEPVYLWVKILF